MRVHTGNDVVEFHDESTETGLVGKGMCDVLREDTPVDVFIVRRWYKIPGTVCFDGLFRSTLTFFCG